MEAMEMSKETRPQNKFKIIILVVLIIAVALLVCLTIFFYKKRIELKEAENKEAIEKNKEKIEKNIERIFEDEISVVNIATTSHIYTADKKNTVDFSKIDLDADYLSNVNVSLKKAKEIIKSDLEVEDIDITFTKIDLEDDNGYAKWKIDFDVSGTLGKYEISAFDGRILSSSIH